MTGLFSEFVSTTKSDWYKTFQKEIEDKGIIGSILRNQLHSKYDPYLTPEELPSDSIEEIQISQKKQPGWLNVPMLNSADLTRIVTKTKHEVLEGADGLWLDCKEDGSNHNLYDILTDLIPLKPKLLILEYNHEAGDVQKHKRKSNSDNLVLALANDPIARWMKTGIAFENEVKNIAGEFQKKESSALSKKFMVEGHLYHNAGADCIQELALMISVMVRYMDALTDAGIKPQEAFAGLFLSVSIGTEFLTEIAKLRALRVLYRRIGIAYGLIQNLPDAFIHASTSSFQDSHLLPHNNMIRSSSEAISAIIGGCDALTVKPYDRLLQVPDDFAIRNAKNVSLIMQHEAHLNTLADPLRGSYYIENLTLEITNAAWEMFLDFENRGGVFNCFESGVIQDMIAREWDRKLSSLKQLDRIIVGVNKFQHIDNEYKNEYLSKFKSEVSTNSVRTLPVRNLALEVINTSLK